MADNPRDLIIAANRGFQGVSLGVFPGGGGYPLKIMRAKQTEPPSRRRIIALKGYQAPESGQALRALDALQLCGKQLEGYRIVIHSAQATHAFENFEQVKAKAESVSVLCGIPIEFMPYSPIETMWELFCKSKISIAISVSDGTPNTLLEAQAVGAFPVQSDTGGFEQWIDSGRNGLLVPFDDTNAIADAIIKAIEDDELVDRAALINHEITNEKLDCEKITKKVLDIYNQIAAVKHDGWH
jgi:glycosyltransferase involved in cell wall biosynthesis